MIKLVIDHAKPVPAGENAVTLMDRIGVDLGTRGGESLVDCLQWAAENDVHYLDVRVDDRLVDGFRTEELETVQELLAEGDIHLGLHNESAVNMAETAPFVTAATEEYLFTYVELAEQLGAEWIVVHGGFHFDDYDERAAAAIDLLNRADNRATGIDLLLENHNPEPADGEIQYMPVTIEECEHFFGELDVGWAFTVNHAHMRPAGIDGFLEALPIDRIGEVRLADNRGEFEEHLFPGEGTIDFTALFDRLESAGFDGHYMNGFGSPQDMLRGREQLVEFAP